MLFNVNPPAKLKLTIIKTLKLDFHLNDSYFSFLILNIVNPPSQLKLGKKKQYSLIFTYLIYIIIFMY